MLCQFSTKIYPRRVLFSSLQLRLSQFLSRSNLNSCLFSKEISLFRSLSNSSQIQNTPKQHSSTSDHPHKKFNLWIPFGTGFFCSGFSSISSRACRIGMSSNGIHFVFLNSFQPANATKTSGMSLYKG